jgi:hypothetical protein
LYQLQILPNQDIIGGYHYVKLNILIGPKVGAWFLGTHKTRSGKKVDFLRGHFLRP